ncbi:MAG: hypothetical protein ACRDKL_06595 [Solirubrobacteraceae bacterium]
MAAPRATIRFPQRRVQTHGARSLWLQEALGAPEPADYPSLEGDAIARRERAQDLSLRPGRSGTLLASLDPTHYKN